MSGFHVLTDDPGMPLKLELLASQRTLEFSASVVLGLYLEKAGKHSRSPGSSICGATKATWTGCIGSIKEALKLRKKEEVLGLGGYRRPTSFMLLSIPPDYSLLDLVQQLSAREP